MAKGDKEFEQKLATEEVAGLAARLNDAPPIGMGTNGQLNVLKPGDVDTWEPEIVTGDEDDGYADLEGDDGDLPAETPEED